MAKTCVRSWKRTPAAAVRGQSEAELEKQAREWFDELVAPTLYPEAEQRVHEHAPASMLYREAVRRNWPVRFFAPPQRY